MRGVHVIEPVGAVLECELVPHVQRVALAMGLCGYRLCRTLPSLFAIFHFCVCDFKRGMIEGVVLSGVCLRKICLRNICVIPGNSSRQQTQVRCKPFELFIAILCLIHRWWVRCLRPNIEACGKCGEVLDVYGDNAVTCKRNNFNTRHQLVVDVLASVLTSADIPIKREVAINGKERRADILSRWMK